MLWKILFTAGVIAAVYFVGKAISRRAGMARAAIDPKDGKTPVDSAVDLIECTACGAYIAPSAGACGRADCPQ